MPQEAPDSLAADQASALKTHLKFPGKMHESQKLNCANSALSVPRISKARTLLWASIPCSLLMCTNFPGELEISLSSRAITNRLLEPCAGENGFIFCREHGEFASQ